MKGMNGFLGGMGRILWDRGGHIRRNFWRAEEVVLEGFLDRGKGSGIGKNIHLRVGFTCEKLVLVGKARKNDERLGGMVWVLGRMGQRDLREREILAGKVF